jgi:hypothetical protein
MIRWINGAANRTKGTIVTHDASQDVARQLTPFAGKEATPVATAQVIQTV